MFSHIYSGFEFHHKKNMKYSRCYKMFGDTKYTLINDSGLVKAVAEV
jgi:hypothetical protein